MLFIPLLRLFATGHRISCHYEARGVMTGNGLDNTLTTYNYMDLPATICDSEDTPLADYTYLAGGMKVKAETGFGSRHLSPALRSWMVPDPI